MKKKVVLFGFICFFYISQAYALVGASFHWGFDFTLKMDDIDFEPAFFDSLLKPEILLPSIKNLELYLPKEIDTEGFEKSIIEHLDVLNKNSPISFRRYDWKKSKINIGGKIYVDEIPIIDAVDLSFNIGAWEYTSELKYPTGELKKKTMEMSDITQFLDSGNYEDFLVMDILPLTLEEFNYDKFRMFNLTQTPFIKLQFDLAIRKSIVALPKDMKIFQLYLGLGPSLHFSTPILTPELIIETVKDQVAAFDIHELGGYLSSRTYMRAVIDRLLEESKNPTFGMNIYGGTMFKIPVIPLGVYIDVKYMIPFQEFDKKIKLDGFGILLNSGICLAL